MERGDVPYCFSQLSGGVAAAAVCALLFGAGHGAHLPSVSPGIAVATEAVLTFFLMLVIVGVATDKRANGAIPGIAIGLVVVADVLIGGPVTGGSMNPARSARSCALHKIRLSRSLVDLCRRSRSWRDLCIYPL